MVIMRALRMFYNDDPTRGTATGTHRVSLEHHHWGAFTVPSLRNVA